MIRPAPLAACLACLLHALVGVPVQAEEVVLVSGQRLTPKRVEIVTDGTRDTGIRATFEVAGGTTQATYAFGRLERRSLFALLERLLIVEAGDDKDGAAAHGRALLRIGDVARGIGAVEDAAAYFVRAGAVAPTLAEARDQRLEAVRAERARALLLDLERELRAGKPEVVLGIAAAFAASPFQVPLSAVERMRMDALVRLARPAVKQPAAVKPVKVPPAAPPAALPAAKLHPRVAAAGAHRAAAAGALDKAADPGVSNRSARRLLEKAARHLLEARRELLRGGPGPIPAAVVQAASAVNDDLVDTYLQVGELLRQEGRFSEARRWLRAVTVLDPENPRAAALATRIEDDLHAPLEPHGDPYYDADPFAHYFTGSYFGTPYFSSSYFHGFDSYRFGGHRHLHRGLRFGVSRHYRLFGSTRAGSGGSRRTVGTRR